MFNAPEIIHFPPSGNLPRQTDKYVFPICRCNLLGCIAIVIDVLEIISIKQDFTATMFADIPLRGHVRQ